MESTSTQLSNVRQEHEKAVNELVEEKEVQLRALRLELTQGQAKAKLDGEKASEEVTKYIAKIASVEKELSETKAAKVVVTQLLDKVSRVQ